jgi:hypothetical protein
MELVLQCNDPPEMPTGKTNAPCINPRLSGQAQVRLRPRKQVSSEIVLACLPKKQSAQRNVARAALWPGSGTRSRLICTGGPACCRRWARRTSLDESEAVAENTTLSYCVVQNSLTSLVRSSCVIERTCRRTDSFDGELPWGPSWRRTR